MRTLIALCAMLLLGGSASAAAQAALPALEVSPNGRYLVRSDGTPFLYLADTAWELFHRLNREEAREYLELRAAQGFTAIQAVALAELDGLTDPNAQGDLPLIDEDPTRPAITPGADPRDARQYDYWDHVDYIVDEANRLGLYVALLPTWGRWLGVNRGDAKVITLRNAEVYGEFLGKRYGRKGVIWVLGGDRTGEGFEETWRALARGIAIGTSGREEYGSVLMTYHPRGGQSSSTWFHDDAWLDFDMWQTGHGPTDEVRPWEKIAADYARSPAKPVVDGEPLYEDHPIGFRAGVRENGFSTDNNVRQRIYWDLFAGAAGVTFGNHAVWQMYAPGRRPINGPLYFWKEAIHRPGAAEMRYARVLMESRPMLSRVPDQSVLLDPLAGEAHIQAIRGPDHLFVYTAEGRPFTVRLGRISGARVKAYWFNPRDGTSTGIGTFENTGTREFTPQYEGLGSDWVLVLDDASRGYAPPGRRVASHDEAETPPQIAAGPAYGVMEIAFRGPTFGPMDAPTRDVDFWVRIQHESGSPTYRIHGFWDGDGRGGVRGNVFKVRFTPTKPGRWTLVEVHSNRPELNGEREGDQVVATPSALHGFWEVDDGSAGRRWYRRSDGSHPYLVGNTHYSFISETYLDGKPNGSDIATDIRRNARYFQKLRFSPIGDRYPNPTAAPFLDDAGKPTYDGDYSFRPNPAWFHRRVDLAVRTAFQTDLVADLILSGVDTEEARSALRPEHNGGDPAPYLRYMAARYGAYPDVWFCLVNEYDIRTPKYTAEQIRRFGHALRGSLAYPTPISVHRNAGPWPTELNDSPSWNDHVIVQEKMRDLSDAADFLAESYRRGGADKPIVDDELSYEGAGDKHSEYDTIEALLGAFLGGGYGTTGYKSGNKLGQYFAGNFDAAQHTAADNLAWMTDVIDRHITFWKMQPVPLERSIFTGAGPGFRAMAWPGSEYLLGTDAPHPRITAHLPAGTWTVTRYDLIAKRETILSRAARGSFTFDAPDSRAVLFDFRKNPG